MLRIINLKKIALFAIIVGIFGAFQMAQALTVSPVRIEVDADPGTTYSGDYRLVNDTNSPRTYYNSHQNFRADGESGTPYFVAEDTGLASWLNGPAAVTLEPFETKTIPFTIDIPVDADPGGYFSSIFWMSQPADSDAGNVSFRLGILVLLRVNGDITEDGGIIEFDSTDESVNETPKNFYYRFQNDGNDRLLPKGTVTIKNSFGVSVDEFDANPQLGNILPLSKRKFDLLWTDGTSREDIDDLSFFGMVSYQLRNFHLGWYTAEMNIQYGSEGQLTDTEKVSFAMFPYQLLIVILGIIIILYFIYRMIRRSMRKAVARQVGDVEAMKEQIRKEVLKEQADQEKEE